MVFWVWGCMGKHGPSVVHGFSSYQGYELTEYQNQYINQSYELLENIVNSLNVSVASCDFIR